MMVCKSFAIICTALASVATAQNGVKYEKSFMIIGGEDALIDDTPYLASLWNANAKYTCVGSVISDRWILTAAHCFLKGKPSFAVCGASNIVDEGSRYDVYLAVGHVFFDPKSNKNDIGMVKTKKRIEFSRKIRPIRLPCGRASDEENYTISGWGKTKVPGNASKILKTVKVQAISNEACSLVLPTEIFPSNLCTLSNMKGTCFGDSGSPLVSDSVIHGIVSWGSRNCDKTHPDVYTRVYNYKFWIYVTKILHYFDSN